jgi:cytochrome b pre-mRNA-processing protein 3
MFLQRLMRPGPARAAGERLYAATVAQARQPAIYDAMGAPDTPNGRFEVYTLHVVLTLERLRGAGQGAAPISQAYFDAYVSGLDHGLRELAVGDLTVPKTMRKLGQAFYGRGRALQAALAALPDRTELEALIRRTVFGGAEAGDPTPLATYVIAARAALDSEASERLLAGEIDWPAVG